MNMINLKQIKMKNFKQACLAFSFLVAGVLTGCSKDDDNTPATGDGVLVSSENILTGGNKIIGNGDKEFVFTGKQTLRKGVYTLKGWVYVKEGAELTIEAGTIIKGDKGTKAALIVEPGAKLFAQGTASDPIVFTSAQPAGSRRPGDWGGLIICGRAVNNQKEMQIEGGPRTKHGGTNDADNSGIIRYVRVEFAGYPFAADKEINGITFGSVGSGTRVDHLQVSYSNDDSYEWFGGAVDCKYLVAYHGWDDEFDTDNGFSGNVQYCLSIRNPRIADISQSNGFESDNCADGAAVAPFTTATFSNVTFIGPLGQDKDFVNDNSYINGGEVYPNNGSGLGKFQAAMQIRRGSHLSCVNSVAVGYPIGLLLDGEKGNTVSEAKAGKLTLQNLWFAGMNALGTDANKVYEDYLVTGYDTDKKAILDKSQPSYSSTYFLAQPGNRSVGVADLKLTRPSGSNITVDYLPAAGSPLLDGGNASMSGGMSFAGAFRNADDNWLAGWTEFDPQHAAYEAVK